MKRSGPHQMYDPQDHTRATLERENFDLRNLIEVSKGLNSTLDYNTLTDSILYTCLGAMAVVKAAFFSKKGIDSTAFSLHRSYLGFEVDHRRDFSLDEKSSLVQYLNREFRCYSLEEIQEALGNTPEVDILSTIAPSIVVPLKMKDSITGILVLGNKIDNEGFSQRDKAYLVNIATFAALAVSNAFLFEMTTTDMLTKLKMKHFFMNTLQERVEAIRLNRADLSVIMMDIDHFKDLNDTHGHLAGDEVLRKVGRLIQDNVRQVDVAARYGGEEFIVLLPEADVNLALIVAERIRNSIADSLTAFGDLELQVTVSLGIAQFDRNKDESPQDLVERADQALYESKDQGRNRTTVLV